MRGNILMIWKMGVVAHVDKASGTLASQASIRVKFDVTNSKGQVKSTQSKTLHPRHLAYASPATVRLPVGTRVIAVYRDPGDPGTMQRDDFYSGIIAEPLKVKLHSSQHSAYNTVCT